MKLSKKIKFGLEINRIFKKFLHHPVVEIVHFQVQIQPNIDGVLSDICKVEIDVKIGQNLLSEKWFVKLVPQQLKKLVIRHQLFNKEITFYR